MESKLQVLRKERGHTQREMADLLNLKTESAYCKKELGYSVFSLKEANIIANFFGKSIEEIFLDENFPVRKL